MKPDTFEMKPNRLLGGSALFGTDPQDQLRTALKSNDFATFKKLVNHTAVNLEHVYEYPDYKTCLELAVSEPNKKEFVEHILHKVEINEINSTYKAAPIHFAVENGNKDALAVLLRHERIDVDIKSKGNTALLLAIKKIDNLNDDRKRDLDIYENMVEQLLKAECNVNIPDLKGITPIAFAAKQGLERIVTLILVNAKKPIHLDTYKDIREKTARDYLKEAFPHLLPKFETEELETETIDVDKLFSYLSRHEEDNFIRDITKLKEKNEHSPALSANNGMNTMLQYAAKNGLDGVVETLLIYEADPNATCSGNTSRPIAIACQYGHQEILKMLMANKSTLFDPVNGESLIQITIKGMQSNSRTPKANFNKCLELLLKHPKIKISLNHPDKKHNTALHYAARNGDQETVLKLLRNGACVGLLNNFNEPPLAGINSETLEIYLDECITTNDKRPSDNDYEIHMRYRFLVDSKKMQESELCILPLMDHSNINDRKDDFILAPETDALLYMTRNEELRPLLKHPVITSFLYLKWQRISCVFYANFAFYLFFCLCLNIYLIFGYGVKKKQPGIETLNIITYFGVFIGLILLICRELFQLLVSTIRYLQSIENWLEILLIIVTALIVGYDSAEESTKQQLSAVAILLSSAELVLLIGQFPTLSTNIAILKTVSLNFLKFLLWYGILILAFALSFYTLFRQEEGEDQKVPNLNCTSNCTKKEEQEDFYQDPGRSMFKTIVMLTGELDTGSFKFSTFPVTSHIIFIVFVFMIPIVLFNLLNALAVSDTQEIRTDAELVGLISRVNVISYFENVLLYNSRSHSRPSSCWSWLPFSFENLNIIKRQMFCIKPFAKWINLFPHFLPKYKLIVKPNKDNKIEIPNPLGNFGHNYEDRRSRDIERGGTCCYMFKRCQNYSLSNIVKDAKNVVSKKTKVTEFDEIKDQLFQNELRIKSLEETMEKVLHALELKRN